MFAAKEMPIWLKLALEITADGGGFMKPDPPQSAGLASIKTVPLPFIIQQIYSLVLQAWRVSILGLKEWIHIGNV